MEKKINWDEAPEGTTHCRVVNGRWYKLEGGLVFIWLVDGNCWTGSLCQPSDISGSGFIARYTPLEALEIKIDDLHHTVNGPESSKHDEVKNPVHYDIFDGQQAIDIIRKALTPEEFAGYCKGNFLKYRLRAGEKGDATKCLAKSNWYQDYLRGLDNE